jgi:manganese/zinc/iron transport system permease protein
VLLGATLLGAVGGTVGAFALIRRQSLLSDALSHAALPGVCIAFLLTGGKHPVALFAGALAAGILGALFIQVVVRGSRVKEDSAIGIVLSVFFGVGVVLLTRIQKSETGNQSGLDRFLFGQAATLMEHDVLLFGLVGLAVIFVVALFYKEFKLLCFDRSFGVSLGIPATLLESLLTCLVVVVVVIGLETVGVVLMVAALVTPAAAARQWTERFSRMIVLSGAIGGGTSALGVLASAEIANVPPGPTIVLLSSSVLFFSLLFAPARGMLWAMLRSHRVARRIREENLLKDLYKWGEQAGVEARVSLAVLMGIRGQTSGEVRGAAARLASRDLLRFDGDELELTDAGTAEAERIVRTHRVWELYLARRLDLPADHVHRDAEDMEHALPDELVREFERQLGYPSVDPHGRPIPPRRDP